jgi:hypothetical protein
MVFVPPNAIWLGYAGLSGLPLLFGLVSPLSAWTILVGALVATCALLWVVTKPPRTAPQRWRSRFQAPRRPQPQHA